MVLGTTEVIWDSMADKEVVKAAASEVAVVPPIWARLVAERTPERALVAGKALGRAEVADKAPERAVVADKSPERAEVAERAPERALVAARSVVAERAPERALVAARSLVAARAVVKGRALVWLTVIGISLVMDKALDRPVWTVLAAELIAVVWISLVFMSWLDVVLETMGIDGVAKLEMEDRSEVKLLMVGERVVDELRVEELLLTGELVEVMTVDI